MKLQTIVDIKPSDRKIGYEDKILMLGSCFSDEIGAQMQQRYLHVTCNPFGTLYNPLSIANAINYKSQITNYELPLVEYDGLWHSMAHHGSFSRPTKEEAEEAVRNSIETMQKALAEATVVIVTFGTAWIYELQPTSLPFKEGSGVGSFIVANCHKMPDSWFTRRRLSVEEIVAAWRPIRFYADDLVHPSSMAVQYIWERFVDTFCTNQTKNELVLQHKRWKHEHHIPLH